MERPLIIGTHTHIPPNDARILKGTGYQTDAGNVEIITQLWE